MCIELTAKVRPQQVGVGDGDVQPGASAERLEPLHRFRNCVCDVRWQANLRIQVVAYGSVGIIPSCNSVEDDEQHRWVAGVPDLVPIGPNVSDGSSNVPVTHRSKNVAGNNLTEKVTAHRIRVAAYPDAGHAEPDLGPVLVGTVDGPRWRSPLGASEQVEVRSPPVVRNTDEPESIVGVAFKSWPPVADGVGPDLSVGEPVRPSYVEGFRYVLSRALGRVVAGGRTSRSVLPGRSPVEAAAMNACMWSG